MEIVIKKKKCRFEMPFVHSAAGLLFLTSLIIFLSGTGLKAQEDKGTEEKSQENIAIEVQKRVIINSHGTEMGTIDENGNVSNISGTFLGSVDRDGNIFNVSMINIGKTTKTGDVMNQSETVMGSVNTGGEIFNISGLKMGEVKGENDISRTGGVARLIFLK